jgi:hypothetical protein
MPFLNALDTRFVFYDFAIYRADRDRMECLRWKPMLKVLHTHGTLLMPMGITWRASKEDITLYGRREDTEEGVVDVFPDKAEKSGVRGRMWY